MLPALAVCLMIAAQTVVAGWVLWSAGNAARAGARAEKVGSDAEAAARRALPSVLCVETRRSAMGTASA